MDGNRGAKGSVKDRLISLLYRLRYKKKLLNEENYTIANKQKQERYIDNLKNFEENEDINILDNEDINKLDDLKFNANFKVQRKSGISNDLLEFKLNNIELKNSELDEKVNLKQEVRKTKDEINILKEIDTFIKKSLENISDIQNELDLIKKESKDKNKDTNKLEERYNTLKQKINKLKLQYDTIKEKYDLSEFSIIESIKLIDSIDDFKTLARLNEAEMMLKVCKNEINRISSVTVVYEKSKNVGIGIDNTKKEQNNVKIKFNKTKENIKKLSSFEKNIYDELEYQQKIVDEMYEKASYFEKNVTKQVEYLENRNILGSLFRIASGIFTLPLTGRQLFGVALGSTLINKGLKEMNRSLKTKEKLVINYKYEDISNQIEQVKDKVEYTNLVLADSLDEIKKLKLNFTNTYSQYDSILPEYNLALSKLDDLENKLLGQQERISSMNRKLDKEKEINKQKLKKLGKG